MDGLLFGMSDVLHDDTVWKRWLWRQIRQLGVLQDYDSLWNDWTDRHVPGVYAGRTSFVEALGRFLRALGLASAAVRELQSAATSQRRRSEDHLRPLAGVCLTLQLLHRSGVRLAVVADSDRTGEMLRNRLAKLGGNGVFQTVISSRDVGCAKPDPTGYEAALDSLGVKPAAAGFVGQSRAELQGASDCGLRTIGFNCAPAAAADVYLQGFGDLLEEIGPSFHARASAPSWPAPHRKTVA
ncbi:MAG: HAD family hydrolase [Planctomycetales bacterium]